MIWTLPLSSLYEAAADFKNRLFTAKILKSFKVSTPVISIGNLTMGGTGKTPFVDYAIKYFTKKNKKVGVIARAYKARAKTPVKVNAQQKYASQDFGDEPVWLAKNNPQASVFVGQTKWQIARWADAQEKLDLLILDDGFQHRYLHRDLDIVILDATESWSNYQVLPAGRGREKFTGLSRADLIILSKCNLALPEELKFLKAQIPQGKRMIETGSAIRQFHDFNSGQVQMLDAFFQSSCLLFCSIARPDVFEKMMSTIFSNVDILSFPDHHSFTQDDVESILNKMKRQNLNQVCCTEKDAVKLREIWPSHQNLLVSELEIDILKGKDELHAIFDQCCT